MKEHTEARRAPSPDELVRLPAHLEAQASIARAFAEESTFSQAAPRLLEAIGRAIGWPVGALWTVDFEDRSLRCQSIWHDGGDAAELNAASGRLTLGWGEALPGAVWSGSRATAVADLETDERFAKPRAEARGGLRSGFGFPIADRGRTLGAIEFFSRSPRSPDEYTLAVAESFGNQIGQLLSRKRAEDATLASEGRKAGILEAALDAIVTIDFRGRVVEFNPAAERVFGYQRGDAVGHDVASLIVPPGLREAHRRALARIVETGEERLLGRRLELRGMRAGGEEFPVELSLARVGNEEPPSLVGYVRDITDRKRAERRGELLADAGEQLTAAVDLESTVAAVTAICVPGLADWCVVDLEGEGRRTERVAVACADPNARSEVIRALERSTGGDLVTADGLTRAMRTARSELVSDVSDTVLEIGAQGPEHLALLRAAGARSAMVIPLRARGRTLGAISLTATSSRRRFDGGDLSLAEEIARRAALAIDSARMHENHLRIAETLQASLLAPSLPRLPGIAIASRFRAAGEAHLVGGDFFDVFASAPGTWTIVMGDVSGKGPEAAAVTALARYTIREASAHEPLPSRVLARLNEAVLAYQAQGGDRLCTALVATLTPTAGGARMTLASGGHPLPVRLDAQGRVGQVGVPGMLIGMDPELELPISELELEPGDSLLFFTDGVTESPTPAGLLGEQGLAALVESSEGLDPDAMLERVERTVLELQSGEPRDDIAMIALQVAHRAPARPAGVARGNGELSATGETPAQPATG